MANTKAGGSNAATSPSPGSSGNRRLAGRHLWRGGARHAHARRQVGGEKQRWECSAPKDAWYERGANSRLPLHGVFSGRMDISQISVPDNASYHLCFRFPSCTRYAVRWSSAVLHPGTSTTKCLAPTY